VESLTHEYPGKIVHLKFFRCDWRQHEPKTLGCAAFEWISAEELSAYSFPEADAQLLKTLKQDLSLWREG
jgi:hypothetical protein